MPAPFATLTGYIAGIATHKDVAALDAYIASEAFLKLLSAVPPAKRPGIFLAYGTARKSCLTRMKIAAAGAAKANWQKPGEIERFKALLAKHGGDRLLVARDMGITPGAVAMACTRFIKRGVLPATVDSKRGSYATQEARHRARPSLVAPAEGTRVAPLSAAA